MAKGWMDLGLKYANIKELNKESQLTGPSERYIGHFSMPIITLLLVVVQKSKGFASVALPFSYNELLIFLFYSYV